MAETAAIGEDVRARLIAEPDVILNDAEVMRALVAAKERSMGENIVDLRGVAMQKLEERLDRLEETHRAVIAAAYDNLSGTNQIHRATLALLEPADFAGFLEALAGDVADILRLDAVRLALETHEDDPADPGTGDVLRMVEPGFVDGYLHAGRRRMPPRAVVLRQGTPGGARLYDGNAGWVGSEALMPVDLGDGRLPGLLVFASVNPHQFGPGQGTDLLGYFAAAFERAMRRWLA